MLVPRLGTSLLTTVADVGNLPVRRLRPGARRRDVAAGHDAVRATSTAMGAGAAATASARSTSFSAKSRYERPIDSRVLTDDEKRSGICLSCRAVPLTNVVIELQEGDRLGGIPQTDGPAVSRKRMKR